MESLYVLVPLSIVLVFVIAGFFWWALKRNQFDALDQAAQDILQDDDSAPGSADASLSQHGGSD